MSKQTAVEWFSIQLYEQGYFDGSTPKSITNLDHLQEQAKQMEKTEHGKTWDAALDAMERRGHNVARAYTDFDDYFAETYVSEGSDEHIVDTNEMINQVPDVRKMVSSQTEISYEYDGLTDDEIIIKNQRKTMLAFAEWFKASDWDCIDNTDKGNLYANTLVTDNILTIDEIYLIYLKETL
jgi:hypothetical protein